MRDRLIFKEKPKDLGLASGRLPTHIFRTGRCNQGPH